MSNISQFCLTFPPTSKYTVTPVGSVATINVGVRRLNKLTVSGNLTINPSNPPQAGIICITILDMYNAGNYVLTFDSNFEWSGGVVPTFSKTAWDRLVLTTDDGVKTWIHVADKNFVI